MSFDVRLPIGLLFLAIGALVTARGLVGGPAVFQGGVMLVLAVLARRGDLPPPTE